MAASMVVGWNFILLALLGGGVNLPLGLPPLPEDPVMQRVAPEECLWYLSWSGSAEPDPKSKNHTEQLLANAEVRYFTHELTTRLMDAIGKGAPRNPQGQIIGKEGPKIIQSILTRPAAIFVSKVTPAQFGMQPHGGAIVNLGDKAEEISKSLAAIELAVLGEGAAKVDGEQWHKLPAPGAGTIEWGVRNKYLVIGLGDGAAQGILERGKSQPPAWMVKLRARLPVERVSVVHYFNTKTIMELVTPAMGREGGALLAALGVNKAQSIATVSGLDGKGYVSKNWVQTDGTLTGLLDVLGAKPLTASDLAPLPKDASFAVAARFDADQAMKTLQNAITQIDPRAGQEMAQGMAQFDLMLGFKLSDDLLKSLGDSWCVYNSPAEGGLILTGLTAVVPVKDKAKLDSVNEKLLALSKMANGGNPQPEFGRRRRGVEVRQQKFAGQTINYLQTIGGEMPLAFAWCITDKQLILALQPQNVRAFLSRPTDASALADVKSVAEQLKTGPSLLAYQDTAENLKIIYPVFQLFANAIMGEIAREGIDLDASLLPSLAAILPHVDPTVSTINREKDGVTLTSRGSLPISGAIGALPLTMPFWLFASRSGEAHAFEQAAPAVRAVEERIEPAPEIPRKP